MKKKQTWEAKVGYPAAAADNIRTKYDDLTTTGALFTVGQKIRLKHKPEISWEIEEVDQVNRWAKLKGVTILPSGRECEWWTSVPYSVLESIDAA